MVLCNAVVKLALAALKLALAVILMEALRRKNNIATQISANVDISTNGEVKVYFKLILHGDKP